MEHLPKQRAVNLITEFCCQSRERAKFAMQQNWSTLKNAATTTLKNHAGFAAKICSIILYDLS